MHNFYSGTLGTPGEEILLPANEIRHSFKTLRASAGDIIGILDGKGGYAEAEITENKKIIVRKLTRQPEPKVKIHLFVAPPKRTKMDQLLKQCTEAGVWAIHPVITEYSVATPDKISRRWQALLQETCKQACNLFVPEIYPPCPLDRALEKIKAAGMSAFYGNVNDDKKDFSPASKPAVAWLVGPEGGFSDAEEQKILSSGVASLNIGPYIMRVETAAVCGVALLNFYHKDIVF